MTNDLIEKFIDSEDRLNAEVNIHFKKKSTVRGLFIRTSDYKELKSKNFWRIISTSRVEEWKKTKDQSLARIFNGVEFTRLTDN